MQWLVVEINSSALMIDGQLIAGPAVPIIDIEPESEIVPQPSADEDTDELEEPGEWAEPYGIRHMRESSLRALNEINDVLKYIKNRRLLAQNSSALLMNKLKEDSEWLCQFVEERCEGVQITNRLVVAGVQDTGSLTSAEVHDLIGLLVEAAWSGVRRTIDLLKKKKHKIQVDRKCSRESMESFKEKCWSALGMFKEGCGQPSDKQVR
ncbi:hypothetical protein PGT21_028904 [Puccinia graminis f. sp. tritici]|nr:hypothetical protein PGT21_028904 [Puccinia graminis f. sp. tritici]